MLRPGRLEVNAMRQMTLTHTWIEGRAAQQPQRADPGSTIWKKLWDYGWPLLLVVLLTLLSVYGPPTRYSKLPSAPAPATQPTTHSIK